MHGYHRSALFVVKITGGGVQARLEEVLTSYGKYFTNAF